MEKENLKKLFDILCFYILYFDILCQVKPACPLLEFQR